MNINLLQKHDKNVITYENILAEFGFSKCIDKVTRSEILVDALVESCIDHIYVRAPTLKINSAVIQYKISDHYMTSVAVEWRRAPVVVPVDGGGRQRCGGTCALASTSSRVYVCPAHSPNVATQRRYMLDNRAVREKLLSVNFEELMLYTCPIQLYDAFRDIFQQIYHSCYVLKRVANSNRDSTPWITRELKNMILERDRLFSFWSNDPKNMIKRLNYTKYRNKCQKLIFKTKNNYDRQCILDCNNNIKKLWDKINYLLGNEKQCLDKAIIKNMGVTEPLKNICNNFARTFVEETEKTKHICSIKLLDRITYLGQTDRSMRWQPVDSNCVKRIITHMDKNKSPGSDLVRMSDLKMLVDKVSPVISNLVNLCVQNGMFPSMLKEAIVRPIYKKGEYTNYSNYRPISILSSVDKIIEKCIINRLNNYLQKNNVITECQHGFQKGKSTNTLLTRFTDEINTYLSEKKFVVAVFFDYKKAFDTLETETLLNAMGECGVGEPLNKWFRDYLTSRSYRVKVGDEYSDERKVGCGVPQGSVCGPVCYLLHVNSLCGVLRHCSAYMFADDLCALRAGTDLAGTCRLVQQDVDAVVKWSHDNGIVLNGDKTKLLMIHSPYLHLTKTCPPIFTHSYECMHNNNSNCKCKPIEQVECVTYLGMKVDESFSWSSHIDYICSKLRILLSKFYNLSFKVPSSTLKCLYMSLVDSILSYCLDCYGLTFNSNIQKLEAIQIRFLKLLVNKKTKNSCKGEYNRLFKICKILPVSLKHKYLLLVNSHGSRDSDSLVSNRYTTRSMTAGKFDVPRVCNYYGDRTLRKRIPYLMNTLPVDIRQEGSKLKFASQLKKHLLNNM